MAATSIQWTKKTWREIPIWPRYQVSDSGDIKNAQTDLVLKLRQSRTGHLYFTPSRGRKYYAHTAVLEAFIGPRPSLVHEGRHLNGVPSNNSLANLAWGTRTENARDRQRHGTQSRGEQAGTAKLTEAQVRQIRSEIGGATLRSLAAKYGVSHTSIRRAANGVKWSHVR